MEAFILKSGQLPRALTKQFGRELTFKERNEKKAYGIGFFKPTPSEISVLSRWFEANNNVIRPHLDQLTEGLIIRLIGAKEINALAISYSEILKVIISKKPDSVTPIIGSPFWVLLKLGVKPRTARWLTWGSRVEFDFGDVLVEIQVSDSNLYLQWQGQHYEDVKQFFGSEFLKSYVDLRE